MKNKKFYLSTHIAMAWDNNLFKKVTCNAKINSIDILDGKKKVNNLNIYPFIIEGNYKEIMKTTKLYFAKVIARAQLESQNMNIVDNAKIYDRLIKRLVKI